MARLFPLAYPQGRLAPRHSPESIVATLLDDNGVGVSRAVATQGVPWILQQSQRGGLLVAHGANLLDRQHAGPDDTLPNIDQRVRRRVRPDASTKRTWISPPGPRLKEALCWKPMWTTLMPR